MRRRPRLIQSRGRRAAGLAVAPYRPATVVHAVYSDPEVAQVGDVTAGDLGRVRVPFAAGRKAHLLHAAGGWLKLAYEPAGGLVRGAVAAGAPWARSTSPIAAGAKANASRTASLAPVRAPGIRCGASSEGYSGEAW